MKKLIFTFLIFSTTALYGQINKELCEKLFYAYQSANAEFSYAKGDKMLKHVLVEQKFQNCEYDLKPSFLENTNFTKGYISIHYMRNELTNKMVKATTLYIRTDNIGELTATSSDFILITKFLRFEEYIKNCFTGANNTLANLTSIENYTHALKYVLYTKNVFTSDLLIDEVLTIDNPYIEISLYRTVGKINLYFGIKIIHRTVV